MSKASEWANASAFLSNHEIHAFVAPAMRPDNVGMIQIHVAVGRQLESPVMCWTDYRVGSVILKHDAALALARWILATFGDEEEA